MFRDTKGVIRNRRSKGRQYKKGQKDKQWYAKKTQKTED
jgi:hypothetical protein